MIFHYGFGFGGAGVGMGDVSEVEAWLWTLYMSLGIRKHLKGRPTQSSAVEVA
jgi:hypothetical protein